jgi:hypothetical protein
MCSHWSPLVFSDCVLKDKNCDGSLQRRPMRAQVTEAMPGRQEVCSSGVRILRNNCGTLCPKDCSARCPGSFRSPCERNDPAQADCRDTLRGLKRNRNKVLLPRRCYAGGTRRLRSCQSVTRTLDSRQRRYHESVCQLRELRSCGGVYLDIGFPRPRLVHFSPCGVERARSNCGFSEHAHRQFTKAKEESFPLGGTLLRQRSFVVVLGLRPRVD